MTKNSPEYVYEKTMSVTILATSCSTVTDIDQIRLISGVEVVDHRSLIQVRKLGHIISLVELGRIDLVDLIGIHFSLLLDMSAPRRNFQILEGSYVAIIALNKQSPSFQLLQHQSPHEGLLRVS